MLYTCKANEFNGEDGQIASARAAQEAPSLLTTLPITTGNSTAASLYNQHLEIIPNPVYSTTTLQYELNAPSSVTIHLYDLAGKKIKSILNQSDVGVGQHQQLVDLSNIYTGIYVMVLQTSFGVTSQKVIIQ